VTEHCVAIDRAQILGYEIYELLEVVMQRFESIGLEIGHFARAARCEHLRQALVVVCELIGLGTADEHAVDVRLQRRRLCRRHTVAGGGAGNDQVLHEERRVGGVLHHRAHRHWIGARDELRFLARPVQRRQIRPERGELLGLRFVELVLVCTTRVSDR
jgi:hypothetical protein